MKLTTNLSGPLIELLRNNEAPIDGIEVGPWIKPKQIGKYRRIYPHHPFYFHGGEIINKVGFIPRYIITIKNYLKATGSPWLSIHTTFLLPGVRSVSMRMGWRIPTINPDRSTQGFIRKVQKLSQKVGVPIIIENPDPIPFYDNFEIQTNRIYSIVEGTNCCLLLDIGHARLSAEKMGITAEEYILSLPMNRVVQVHVSGPRIRDGHLFDAHEPLQQVDYDLLDFVLKRSKPQVITLEYIRQIDALRDQLVQLRRIIN